MSKKLQLHLSISDCSSADTQKKRTRLLGLARRIAVDLALGNHRQLCTTDDVYCELRRLRKNTRVLGPAIGSVFRSRDWRLTSFRVRSTRPGNNGREIKIFRYVGIGGVRRQRNPRRRHGEAFRVTRLRERECLDLDGKDGSK